MAESSSKLKKYHCKGCGCVLAEADENYLYIGAVLFPLPVTFMCAACGRANKWKPTLKKPNRQN